MLNVQCWMLDVSVLKKGLYGWEKRAKTGLAKQGG
jgi:hypothetical protein